MQLTSITGHDVLIIVMELHNATFTVQKPSISHRGQYCRTLIMATLPQTSAPSEVTDLLATYHITDSVVMLGKVTLIEFNLVLKILITSATINW